MVKQNINIVGIQTLYNILEEIKKNLAFQLINYNKEDEFLKFLNEKKIDITNSLIITKINNKNFFFKKTKIEKKNIIFLSEKNNNFNVDYDFYILKYPIEIYNLIEKINIQLIKKKYNYQSKIKVNKYHLDLNSRIISNHANNLKLTEKEMNIILFLKDNKIPQKITILQNQVWGYSSDLETHTVETHIYRLRKKINDNFKDANFIISTDDGYLIK
mgnify:CR=1 FL=1